MLEYRQPETGSRVRGRRERLSRKSNQKEVKSVRILLFTVTAAAQRRTSNSQSTNKRLLTVGQTVGVLSSCRLSARLNKSMNVAISWHGTY